MCNLGELEIATPVLIEALNETNLMVRVHALNSLEILGGEVAKASISRVKKLVIERKGKDRGYDIRAGKRLIEIYE